MTIVSESSAGLKPPARVPGVPFEGLLMKLLGQAQELIVCRFRVLREVVDGPDEVLRPHGRPRALEHQTPLQTPVDLFKEAPGDLFTALPLLRHGLVVLRERQKERHARPEIRNVGVGPQPATCQLAAEDAIHVALHFCEEPCIFQLHCQRHCTIQPVRSVLVQAAIHVLKLRWMLLKDFKLPGH